MDFWSDFDDDFLSDEEDDSQIPLDSSYINYLSKLVDDKIQDGFDFTLDELSKLENALDYCIENGFFTTGLKFCDTLLQYYPTSSDLLTKKGYLLLNLKDVKNAINFLQQSLEINPNDTDTLFNLSWAYYNTGEYSKSLVLIDKVLSIEPSDYALYHKGVILQTFQKYDEALEAFRALLDSEEYKAEAMQEISHILFIQGKYEESIQMNLKAIEKEPDNYWFWFNLGISYLELERYYKAIDAFSNAIAINPDFEYSYLYLGWSYANLGRYKQAIYSLLKYSGYKFDKYVFFEIANILGDIGYYREAIRFYEKIIDKDFLFGPAHIGVALCYKHLGDHKTAEEFFKIGVSLDPKNPEFWLMAIKHLLENRKVSKAFSMFSNALTNNPKNEELLQNFHNSVYKYRRFEEGIEILENLKQLNPNDPTLLFYLGEFYARTGQMNKAIEYFTESIHLNNSMYNRLKSIMHLILRKKDYSLFERMLNLKLSSPQIKFNKD